MTLAELQKKYGGFIKDWTTVSNDDLYEYLDSNREGLIALLESGTLKDQTWAKEVVRRCEQDLMWLAGWFLHETNPETSGNPISANLIRPENHAPFLDFFVKKDKSKKIAEQDTIKNRLILYPRGSMKALDVDILIPTPDGFKKMADIQVGDFVFSDDGKPARVNAVSPIYYNRDCYAVRFSTGEEIVADEGHLWLTDARKDRDRKKKNGTAFPAPSIKTTKQIAESVFVRKEHNHRISVSKPICAEGKPLPIHPYVLGYWLGDGTTDAAQLTIGDADADDVVREILSFGQNITKTNVANRWALHGGAGSEDFRTKNSFRSKLRQIGLLGSKRIPIEYLRASYEQRLLLLQGLMDSDGTISPDGRINFNNTNRALIGDAIELVASLGFKPSLNSTPAKLNGKLCGTSYFLNFQAYKDTPIFRLRRKAERLPERKKISLQNYRQIVSVERVNSRPVKCISVDNESHLYLVGRTFIPTHNSTWGIADVVQWVLNFPEIRILILTAADDLAVAIVDEIKGHFLAKIYDPTLMNIFFPQFCKEEKDMGDQYSFNCPVWEARNIRRRETTIMASSVTSTLSGFHYEVMHCLSPETWIYTEDGMKQVKELRLGEKLLTHMGRYRPITMMKAQAEERVKVTLERFTGFPTECSEEHQFLTDKGWTKAKDLKKGDKILRPFVLESPPSPLPYDKELWRAIGWWVAEGSITSNSQIHFSLNAKDEMHIVSWLGELFIKYGAERYSYDINKNSQSLKLHIHKTPKWLIEVFRQMYVGPFRKQIPAWALNSPKEMLSALCRGLWDGDGDSRDVLTTVSKEIAGTSILAKHQLGLGESVVHIETGQENGMMRVYGRLDSTKLYSDFSIVKKVEHIGHGPTVALEIDEDHTLCVPGAITHNCDDMVSNRNSENEDQCLKVNKNFKINKKMLRPFGYCTKIGTRYHDSDAYGIEIENNIGEYETSSGEGWELTRNKTTSSLILIGRAIQVKPEIRASFFERSIPPHLHYQEAGEEGCTLVMPKVLSYSWLLGEYNRDRAGERQAEEGTFEGQMNQNPTPEEEAVFDMPLLLRRTLPFTELPYRGLISHTWDFAFGGKKSANRDFSTGSSVIWNDKGQAFVNDLVRDRFPTPTSLAKAIVDLAKKHHPFVIGVEDAGASRFLEPTIITEAYKTGDPFVIQVCSKIDWIPIDNQREAKKARMAALQPLLADDLLHFANYLPYLKTLYEEFMRCQVNLKRHNDIPDVISYQPRYAPRILKQIVEQGISTWSKDQAAYNLIYEENTDPFGLPGGGGVMTATFGEPKISEDFVESNSYAPGLDNMLGGGLIG